MPEAAPSPAICPTCHQPVLPAYYFCPNCGTNLRPKPLPTDPWSQAQLYVFSIILPMICFLFVTRWQGMYYVRSQDSKAKQIGMIAWTLLIASTVLTIYFAYIWTQEAIQSATDSINADMSM